MSFTFKDIKMTGVNAKAICFDLLFFWREPYYKRNKGEHEFKKNISILNP